MMTPHELRTGNRVYWRPNISNTDILIKVEIVSVLQDKVGYTPSHLEHRVEPFEDLKTNNHQCAAFAELEPIPIDKIFLDKLNTKVSYPEWIRYVHELQNWYYWQHEKRELELND